MPRNRKTTVPSGKKLLPGEAAVRKVPPGMEVDPVGRKLTLKKPPRGSRHVKDTEGVSLQKRSRA